MCYFLMRISAKYLEDTKDKKWCSASLFSLLFKPFSLLLDPFVFPVLSWVFLKCLRKVRALLHTEEKGAVQMTISSVLHHEFWSTLPSF